VQSSETTVDTTPTPLPVDTAQAAVPLPATDTAAAAVADTEPSAATAGDTVAELDRMVVTATRTRRQMSDVPVSVSLIDRQTIDASPATRVDDLLMKEAGVSVKRVVGMAEGIPSDIIIRGVPGGFASTRTLILVDGVPTNVAGTPLLIINQVPLEAVERVELVRGPFSSLYGANAFNGVVNILTRQPQKTEELAGSLEFFPGLYADVGLRNAGRFGHVSYSLCGGLRRIDNYLLADSALVRERDGRETHVVAENYDYEDERVLGRLNWWPNDRVSIGLQARYFGCELGFGRTQDDANAEMVTSGQLFLVGPTFTATISDGIDIGISGYFRRLGAEFLNSACIESTKTYIASKWKSYTNDGQVEAHATLRLGQHNTLTAGADFLGNAVEFGATRDRVTGEPIAGFDSGSASIADGGVYVQDELRLWDRLNVVPGIRLDYHSEIGLVLSPKLACSYRATDWLTARLSGGRAFRAPSLVETSMPPLPLLSDVTLFPTPGLVPEYIWAVDAGLDMVAARVLKPTVNGFFNWMDDLITPSVSARAGGQTDVHFRNISQAWSTGCELGADLTLPAWVRWYANYTYTYSQDLDILEEIGSVQPLDYVPPHTVNLGVEVKRDIGRLTLSGSLSEAWVARRSYLNWQGGAIWEWQTSENIDYILPDRVWLHSYWRTDLALRLSYRDYAFIAVTASNLFNARYEESGGVLAPGRLVAFRVGGGF